MFRLQEAKQVTFGPKGHNLTNAGVWSPDNGWIVYDTRLGERGAAFDGNTIEAVNVDSGETQTVYRSSNGAHCGVATWHPHDWRIVFILGPEYPTPDWLYGFSHRQGVVVEWDRKLTAKNLDARDLVAPFTRGALRGGSHVHVWNASGDWISFTYNDALVESEVRDIGVCIPGQPVSVQEGNIRNHLGEYFSVVVTRTKLNPMPGSNEIKRACEESWIGTDGYLRSDGTHQRRALAFQGTVLRENGDSFAEVFVVDLPEDLSQSGDGPLAGTTSERPSPPKGVLHRRLTFTADRKYPGIQGVRHWLRSSPDGSLIACLMKDDHGIVQLWTVETCDGTLRQLTRNTWPIASAFTWSPNGNWIAHAMDNSIFMTDTKTGASYRLTIKSSDQDAPLPEACVFSNDGSKIAFMRRQTIDSVEANQIFVVGLPH